MDDDLIPEPESDLDDLEDDGDDGWVPAGWEDLEPDDDKEDEEDDGWDFDSLIASVDAIDAYEESTEQLAPAFDEVEPEHEPRFYMWEQLPGEPDEAFAIFSALRDLPPTERTVNNLARVLYNDPDRKEAPRHWRRWSKQFDWFERLRAFTQWKNRRIVDHEITMVAQRKEQMGVVARAMQRKVVQAINKMEGDEKEGIPARDLPLSLVPSWTRISSQLEMLSMGESEKQELNVAFSQEVRVKVEVVFIMPENFEARQQEAEAIKQELIEMDGGE